MSSTVHNLLRPPWAHLVALQRLVAPIDYLEQPRVLPGQESKTESSTLGDERVLMPGQETGVASRGEHGSSAAQRRTSPGRGPGSAREGEGLAGCLASRQAVRA
jgi:hypothetical protein